MDRAAQRAMPPSEDDLALVMVANAKLLQLDIAAAHRAGVLRYLALAASMAALVMAFELDVEDESGSVFRPVAPELGP